MKRVIVLLMGVALLAGCAGQYRQPASVVVLVVDRGAPGGRVVSRHAVVFRYFRVQGQAWMQIPQMTLGMPASPQNALHWRKQAMAE